MANAEATTAVVEHEAAGGEHHVEPSALGLGPGAWVALAMFIFLAILVVKKVPGAIVGGLDKQIGAIRKQLDEAKVLRAEAEKLRAEYAAKIANAEKDAAAMVEHAKSEAAAIVAKAEADAAAVISRREKMASDKIAAAERAAVDDLRAKAAEAATAAARLDLGKLYDYDIILLDLNLPDMHGYDVLKKLRVAKVQTPVLILSGISEMDSKVRSFGFGADDYVTKPFHREELIARIHAVVRRSKGHSQSVIRTGKLSVNLDAKTVEVDGARVHLTGKEYAMLELLSLRKGTTLTKEMFLNHLYGGMDEPELKIIDVFICKLRKKLAHACGGENYIETVWGRGYVLRDPDDMSAIEAA